MKTLNISFAVTLENYFIDEFRRAHGPYFHKWLPDGDKDALTINMGSPNIELKLWFERKGYVRADGIIVYDQKKHEVDENIMARQAILDAGPLFGQLTINNVTEAQIEVLQQDKRNDPNYIQLGKELLNFIYPVLSRLITILRVNYGQYWIRELEPWDSRKYPLGHYCQTFLEMRWALDNEQTWRDFKPSDGPITIRVQLPSDEDYLQYLLPEDYKHIEKLLNENFSPSLAATSIGLAHQSLDRGNFKHAIIEAVTALEIALEEFHRSKFNADKELLKQIKAFWDLPLRTQLLVSANSLPECDLESLKEAVRAIDMRNNVVHEGWNPPNNAETFKTIQVFLKLISLFVEGPKFKFAEDAQGANTLYAPS